MRLITFAVVAAMLGSGVSLAQSIRVVDTIEFRGQPQSFLDKAQTPSGVVRESQARTVTTTVTRVIRQTDVVGAWIVIYEEMTTDKQPVVGAAGRAYTVTVSDDSLEVTPVAPTDSEGLKGVVDDLGSLAPLFKGQSICGESASSLCPDVLRLLARFGKASGTIVSDTPKIFSIDITGTPDESTLRGSATLETDKWIIKLNATRNDQISLVAAGVPGKAVAQLSAQYALTRVLQRVP